MARTRLTVVDLANTHPGAGTVIAGVVADIVDHNDFLLTGREILIIDNTGAGPLDVTIGSAPDPYGRSGDLVVTVAAATKQVVQFDSRDGWMQPDGALYLDTTAIDIEYTVLRLPA